MAEPVDILEALLFASDVPVEAGSVQEVLGLASPAEAVGLMELLRRRLDGEGRALQVVEVGGGFRLVTRPEVAPWLVKLARSRTRSRLSRPALETLAIVAYRQPVSRPEVDTIRGVNSEGVLDSLLERRMVRIAGRKDSPGRPFLYETTRDFLVAFGLRDLADLPKVDGELVLPGTPGAEIAGAPLLETSSAVEEGSARPPSGGDGQAAAVPREGNQEGMAAGANSPQQDPGAGGPDLPPRG